MANVNSLHVPGGARRRVGIQWVAVALLFAAGMLLAGDPLKPAFAERARAELQRAGRQFQSHPENSSNAWLFARACFDLAGFATNKTERAAVAQEGIDACRAFLARDSHSAPAHYYLGLDLGQLARTKRLGALRLVREMEGQFKTAFALDGSFDFAGPARSLGLLYRDAPGWPLSIGSRRKARQWLEIAATLAPDYPGNLLNLVESFLKWSDRGDARKELERLDALWPAARTNFTGAAWEQCWDDWTTRRAEARQKLGEPSRSAKSGAKK
ncbi:MAG: hypothetical protein KGJ88_13845 [Verrucomicrobiota bacterium]|nr:hypothetical protein [Verrucomicrobiota bacterium]